MAHFAPSRDGCLLRPEVDRSNLSYDGMPTPGSFRSKLTGVATPKQEVHDYHFDGKFDLKKLQDGFREASFNAKAHDGFLELIAFIEEDHDVKDIRWAAYMLATAYWETANKMIPNDEGKHKEGKKKGYYFLAVKIKQIKEGQHKGQVLVTQQNGEKIHITPHGHPVEKYTIPPESINFPAADKKYTDDDGVEKTYAGRGYVQLTNFLNYAKAGVALGKGFDFLLDPELVKEKHTAYDIMSDGMRNGTSFANKRTLSQYAQQSSFDYEGARAIVNEDDDASVQPIASFARQFEKILNDARSSPTNQHI